MLHLKNLDIASYLEYVTEDQDFRWQEIKKNCEKKQYTAECSSSDPHNLKNTKCHPLSISLPVNLMKLHHGQKAVPWLQQF